MWSVGNENHSPGTIEQIEGLKKYTSFVRSMDPTRPVISGMERGKDGVPEEKVDAIIKTCDEMDLIALNY
jgi:beta-galactosidase